MVPVPSCMPHTSAGISTSLGFLSLGRGDRAILGVGALPSLCDIMKPQNTSMWGNSLQAWGCGGGGEISGARFPGSGAVIDSITN